MASKFTFRRYNTETFTVTRWEKNVIPYNVGVSVGVMTWDVEEGRFVFFANYLSTEVNTLPAQEFCDMKAAFNDYWETEVKLWALDKEMDEIEDGLNKLEATII